MRYRNVCLESFGVTLPEEVIPSVDIERRLAPLYERLRLPEGRLELMSGICERRFWEPGTLPSEKSIDSAEKAIRAAGIDRQMIGALLHGSVCRDHLEPATACKVHHGLGLSPECMIYDVSNACLGLLNGMVQIANMIELGQIRAGIVVGTESSRQLVESTIDALNSDKTLTRQTVKSAVASLTIGSASCAILLVDRELSRTDNRITSAVALTNTSWHDLCQSGADEAVADGMRPLMQTDSEALLREGIATGAATFKRFLEESGWTRAALHKTFCHQVGVAHQKMLFETLGLDPTIDFATLDWLGNTGSTALPTTMALGIEKGHLRQGDHVGMLGIGSGINSVMIGVDWQTATLSSDIPTDTSTPVALSTP